MEEQEKDVEFLRGLLTRKMETGEDVVLQSDRAAVLRNVDCPKAQIHFIILPKQDIAYVTALTPKHLPLLEHMMELANQIIEKEELPSSNFRVGFKINPFMNRLNMHVISDDFCSEYMRRINQWNTFNSDLFITYQAVYALLLTKGYIEPLSADVIEKLRRATPVHCNQCTFITGNFEKFKAHLDYHWSKREGERERLLGMGVSNLTPSLGELHLNGTRSNFCGAAQPKQFPFTLHSNVKALPLRHQPGILGSYPPRSLNMNYQKSNHSPSSHKHPDYKPIKQVVKESQKTNANQAGDPPSNANAKQTVDQAQDQPVKTKPFVNKKK
ncbi:aprataxin-like protein [Drosophila grimshawi]|uniref:aprataxin-like protein n=3 Tax=Drosophila grimshawi TaxID=7222 RepID=UPI000C86EAA2|nr:aprataxin-like protein [Drosophila grimshawi]XP_032597688.1 aprataxin-like protein [Drosophila grimshawi]XP_032597691.1 aprataxin-like protein [Drosophila grimshawi]XP_032598449.2 aprataxin-like protein [Drosophila grimshawi]XP_043071680.1 aprataxin-like protein [Drosophila grimshawi]XP_043071681.1 aprataxin-like protein [Drosophila grimshawi]XP_043071682.1 aprataxin-like protein [Drosophila grimshawi]